MKGLTLSRLFFEEVGRPALTQRIPALFSKAAAGLVGEGSECLGYDDELSRDHDWGPGFCIWLTDEDFDAYGAETQAVYDALPHSFLGFERLRVSALSAGRVGVMRITDFYERFLGLREPPRTVGEWLSLNEQALCICSGGEVFEDGAGVFSAFRNVLTAYYPEDIRRKHLAARCAIVARSGQYQLQRCLSRGDLVAASCAQAEFIDNLQAALFLLERRYRPYYKWAHRAMKELPRANEAVPLFELLVQTPLQNVLVTNEELCRFLVRLLREEGLSLETDSFLLPHAESVQRSIHSDGIRNLPLFSFP